jgi:hypothetical protein
VLVLQPGGARGLAPEALDELLVLGRSAGEELERHLAPELQVLRAETSAMPPEPSGSCTR